MKFNKLSGDYYEYYLLNDGRYLSTISHMEDNWWLWQVRVDKEWRDGGKSISLRAAKCKAKKYIRWHKAGFYDRGLEY
jgi:hypothetical protein